MVRRPDGRDENTLLIAARKNRGLRRAQAARALEAWARQHGHTSFTCTEDKYRSWEYGVIPHPYAWPVLTGYFDKTAAELGLTGKQPCAPAPAALTPPGMCTDGDGSPTVEGGQSEHTSEGDRVLRRQFAAAIPASLAAPLVFTHPTAPQVNEQTVARLRDSIATLRHLDSQVGGDTVHPLAAQLLAQGRGLLAQARPNPHTTAMHLALGELAACTGWFAYDAGNHHLARAYLGEAMVQTRLADDPMGEAQACNHLANLALRTGHAGEALRLVQLGQRLVHQGGAPKAKALFAMREAQVWAKLGDQKLADAAAGRAWDHLATDHTGVETPRWAAYVNETELRVLTAIGANDLGGHDRAAERFERSVADISHSPRTEANWNTLLAHARLECGELDGACAAARQALAANVASTRVRRRLEQFAAKARRLNAEVTRAFSQQWDQWRATRAATPAVRT